MSIDIFNRLRLFRTKSAKNKLGVYLGHDAVWVYKNATQSESAVEKEYLFQNKDWQQVFSTIASDFGPSQLEIVLSAAWYQLLIIDKPNVEEQEIAQALIWAIKDMVSTPVVDLNLEYYDTPVVNRNKVTLVVTDKKELIPLVENIYENQHSIAGMSIEQLAICNLEKTSKLSHMVISHYKDQELLLTFVKDAKQYMQRRVRGFQDLHRMDEALLKSGVVDNLSLQVRRSMDFYESQLRQPPVQQINVLTDGASQVLTKLLQENFSQPISLVNKTSVGGKMAALAYENFTGDIQ